MRRFWAEREGERGGGEVVWEEGEVGWEPVEGKDGEVGVFCAVGEVGAAGVVGDASGEETDDEERGLGRLTEEVFMSLEDPGLCFNKPLASSN